MNSTFQWSLFKLVEMTIRKMNIFIEYQEKHTKRMVVNNEA